MQKEKDSPKGKASSKLGEVAETPLMKQYNVIKAKYPDALLLFRVGDFYETFGEDAIKTASILGIVLTRRANGSATHIELAGFPYHSLDSYLPKLVRAGHRVAICDQLEDPKLTKTIVKRGVTELVTPGVSYNDKVLDTSSNNFLASVYIENEGKPNCLAGVSFLDISTGEFLAAQGSADYVDKLLQSFRPSEILFQKSKKKDFQERFGDKTFSFALDDWIYTKEFTDEILLKHFETNSLKGFGIQNMPLGVMAAGAALKYLADTAHDKVQHISSISRIEEERFVWLDRFTIRNLELFDSPNDNSATLIAILDHSQTPMGARALKRWLAFPLKDKLLIDERLDAVEFLTTASETTEKLCNELSQIGDLERLISKVAVGRILPREILQLKRALHSIEKIKALGEGTKNKTFIKLSEQLNLCLSIRDQIEKQLMPDPPALINKGNVIASGVNHELDELRKIAFSGKDYLLKIQHREQEITGIPSLKISFNNVFGYYLEVTNTHKNKVPAEWIRKQTLVNAERYITPELKEYEEKILGAEDKILQLETKLYNDLVLALATYINPVQLNATTIAQLDCLVSFAICAQKNNYVRPHINDSFTLEIKNGRHPVIEQKLAVGLEYVTNDIYLDNDKQQIIIITGPNMSGKSALLRQTALIVIMAQMGSFVPAQHANIGIVDKVFTRVGASDNISSGESTFMVEMNETASILNNLSNRSLVLLDEIGRGTSTYDGISIAWSIAEYIHENPNAKAKTLFATHYHELNEMSNTMPRIKNFNVSVREVGNKVLFLRKLIPGGSEHSFGIHVAHMAGMPRGVIERAEKILVQLEKSNREGNNKKEKKVVKDDDEKMQLSFFQLDDPVLQNIKDELIKTDINTLTPVEALMKLNEIKKMVGGK